MADAGGILENKPVQGVRVSLVGEILAPINTRSVCFPRHTFETQFTFIEHLVIVCLPLNSAPGNRLLLRGPPWAVACGG